MLERDGLSDNSLNRSYLKHKEKRKSITAFYRGIGKGDHRTA